MLFRRTQLDTIVQSLTPEQVYAILKQQGVPLTDQIKDAVRTLVKVLQTLRQPLLDALAGLLGYVEGLLCFGCDPTYRTNLNVKTGLLLLTQRTCTGLSTGACVTPAQLWRLWLVTSFSVALLCYCSVRQRVHRAAG